jgi:hypothetical protein
MSLHTITPPARDEYPPYFQTYLDTLPEGKLMGILEQQMQQVRDLLLAMNDEQAEFRYAEGKWSVKELIGHMIDTERIFSYRALCIARGERAALPGYDQDRYNEQAGFPERTRSSLSGEYEHLRKSNLFLFPSWDEGVQQLRGIADGSEVSVRALAWIIAGHERYHLGILNERYLPHLS